MPAQVMSSRKPISTGLQICQNWRRYPGKVGRLAPLEGFKDPVNTAFGEEPLVLVQHVHSQFPAGERFMFEGIVINIIIIRLIRI